MRPSRTPAGAAPAKSLETAPPQDATAFSKEGVDRTLIRWMLSLTPAQRLEALQGFVDSVRVEELIHLPSEGAKAKPYQVHQVRRVVLGYRLGELSGA